MHYRIKRSFQFILKNDFENKKITKTMPCYCTCIELVLYLIGFYILMGLCLNLLTSG